MFKRIAYDIPEVVTKPCSAYVCGKHCCCFLTRARHPGPGSAQNKHTLKKGIHTKQTYPQKGEHIN